MNAAESTSTRPYLIRALYEWCCDNGLTPYVAVSVDDTVQVPREYVKNNEIVLNISGDATSSLNLGNDFIGFKARFAGSAREIMVPISHVIAIYARENGQGMAFPMLGNGPGRALDAKRDRDADKDSGDGPPGRVKGPDEGSSGRVTEPSAGAVPTLVDSKIMQLVPESGTDGNPPPDDTPEPPRPRPPLKRVK